MKKYLVFAAAVIVLAGCAKEKPAPTPGTDEGKDLLLSINPKIAEMTKATATSFEEGDKIGLDVLVDGESDVFLVNAPLTYKGTSFSAENLNWYKDTEKTSVLTAYYPYSESGRPASVTVPADQSAGAASSDFLGAVLSGAKPSESAVSMTFKHLLSKVEIRIDNQTSEAVSALTIGGLVLEGNLDFTALSSAATGSAAATVTPRKVSDNLYEILIPAQTASLTASLTLGGGTVLENQQSLSTTLVSGKKQEWTIEVTEHSISITVNGDIEDWETGADILFPTEKNYAYKTVTLSNGQTWMAEPLRYVPEGKAVSTDPNDGNGVWFPYKVVDGVAVPLTDKASIEKLGYLYDYPTALGATLTAENYSSFEGAQGICPDGWHLPTRAEFIAICGYSNKAVGESADITDKTAVFWDAAASTNGYATVVKANEAGFNFTFSGSTQKNTPEATGKYPTTVITADKTEIENYVGELAMTYLLGSTSYQWKAATATVSAYAQFFGMMTTFTSTYKQGRLTVGYTNERAGYSIRCIKDGWTAK